MNGKEARCKSKAVVRARAFYTLVIFLAGIFGLKAATAEDWPTYMHDNARSGVVSELLALDELEEVWVHHSPAPPARAWCNDPRWDAWSSTSQVPMRDFDTAIFVTVVGENVYIGSSVTESVHCLDITTGQQKWFFRTDGPVRFPPSYYDGKLYFGSDDGYVYCITADAGSLVWKYSPAGDTRILCNNGKLITTWPVRTGTAVLDGKVYFAVSLVPWKTSYLCSVDAMTGSATGSGLYKVTGNVGTAAGPILASNDNIYLTQGRFYPRVYSRASGGYTGTLSGSGGGVYALLTSDGSTTGFIYGQGRNNDKSGYELNAFSDRLANHPDGKYMVVAGGVAYVITETFSIETDKGYRYNTQANLKAIDRATAGTLWSVNLDTACWSLILAGDVLFTGRPGKVVAHSATDGSVLWSRPATGHVRGLAAANGRLFVSTDMGKIYMFGSSFLLADFDKSGTVDLADLAVLAGQYLQCTDPAEPGWCVDVIP
jgi:outer membrane protein assembly factor BamB